MKPLWAEWPKIRRHFLPAKMKLLLLDFDGTLAPIARVPRAVKLSAGVRRCLSDLAARPDYRLCLISGRSIRDLKQFIRDPRWIYVGNHGLEIEGRGLSVPERARRARAAEPLIGKLARRLQKDLAEVAGVLVEDKGFTMSLHFRNVPRGLMPLVLRAVRSERRRAEHRPLLWRRGKKVWEVRPRIEWNKGRAALYVKRRFPFSKAIVLGDDRTDEDMFRALKGRAVTVRVGRANRSRAGHYLRSQKEVGRFLEDLCR